MILWLAASLGNKMIYCSVFFQAIFTSVYHTLSQYQTSLHPFFQHSFTKFSGKTSASVFSRMFLRLFHKNSFATPIRRLRTIIIWAWPELQKVLERANLFAGRFSFDRMEGQFLAGLCQKVTFDMVKGSKNHKFLMVSKISRLFSRRFVFYRWVWDGSNIFCSRAKMHKISVHRLKSTFWSHVLGTT